MSWRVTKTTEHSVELENVPHDDGNVWNTAHVKWDRCVHYRRYFNAPANIQKADGMEEDACYLHICSVADEIDHLLTFLEAGRKHCDTSGYWEEEAKRVDAVLRKHGL
jgi:hypothetical protein